MDDATMPPADTGVRDTGARDTGAADTGAGDAGGADAGGPDAGPATLVPICYASCRTAADCDEGLPSRRAANFDCAEGACRYRGCLGDDDCPAGGAFLCRPGPASVPECERVCFDPAECVTGGGTPVADTDNFSCATGACRWLGCLSDAECQSTYSAEWVCRPDALSVLGILSEVPICVRGCATPADCAVASGGPFDADNFECDGAVCRYTGCNGDAECATLSGAVCR